MSGSPGMPVGYDQLANPYATPKPKQSSSSNMRYREGYSYPNGGGTYAYDGTPMPAISGAAPSIYQAPNGKTPPPNTQQFAARQKLGGGWTENWAPPSSKQLQDAFAHDLTGESAVQYATQHGAPGIAYYPDRNQYGLPDGAYAAPGPEGLDLIERSAEGPKQQNQAALMSALVPGHASNFNTSSSASQLIQQLIAQLAIRQTLNG